MYEEFMRKIKSTNTKKFTSEDTQEMVIAIPLKGGQGAPIELDDNFVKVIQYEYAVKYLEQIGI